MDANGILQVSATDKSNSNTKSITITPENELSQSEIEEMLRMAEEFAEEDRQMREKIQAKNDLEEYLDCLHWTSNMPARDASTGLERHDVDSMHQASQLQQKVSPPDEIPQSCLSRVPNDR